MRKRISFVLVLLSILCFTAAFVLSFHKEFERLLLEFTLNQSTKGFFANSLHIEKAYLDWHLGMHVRHVAGKFQSEAGPIPLVIQSIESEGPLTDIFSKDGIALHFEGVRPEVSKRQGINGIVHFKAGKDWSFHFKGDVQSLDLGEIEWLSPENLTGSVGEMRGLVDIRTNSRGEISFSSELRIQEPGGRLQSRFFDILTPYLPQLATKEKVRQVAAAGGLVGFRDASLKADLVESDKMKAFLHISIPDYNLDLNLNMEIRLDENAFEAWRSLRPDD